MANVSLSQGHRVRGARKRAAHRDRPIAAGAEIDLAWVAHVVSTRELAASAFATSVAKGDPATASAEIAGESPPDQSAPAYRPRSWRRSTGRKVAAAILGASLAGGGAYAATNWIVGLNGGSSGEGQAAAVQNLTVAAVASPAATNQLYPGGTGDVVLTITNPNPYPVTVTAVDLPTNTTYATGYTTSALTTTQAGCLASSPSDVIWNFATSSSGSVHTLTSPVTVGPSGNANDPLTVTLTNDASMTAAAPAACEATYFSMPSLTGVVASGGAGTVTSTPVVDGWTS
ncbi:MAG: hypothetical protein ACHQFZ_05140 [Acidimicrobiales bacterium]